MEFSAKATGFFTFISILFFAGSAQSQNTDSIYTLKKGTQIHARMDNEINSEVSSVGDTFTTTVSTPVKIRGVEILPAGAVIEGRIIGVKKASLGKKDGRVEVKFETLYLSGGEKRLIEAGLAELEKPKEMQTASIATVAGSTGIGALLGSFFEKTKGALVGAGVGIGIGTSVILLRKGKEARIRAEEGVTVILKQDVTLPVQDY